MPMKKNSTPCRAAGSAHKNQMSSVALPCRRTIEFIRQFARAYQPTALSSHSASAPAIILNWLRPRTPIFVNAGAVKRCADVFVQWGSNAVALWPKQADADAWRLAESMVIYATAYHINHQSHRVLAMVDICTWCNYSQRESAVNLRPNVFLYPWFSYLRQFPLPIGSVPYVRFGYRWRHLSVITWVSHLSGAFCLVP